MRGKGAQNLDDSLDQREITQAIDENSRCSKYRLFSLEKKVESQKLKARGKMEHLDQRMQNLQNFNHVQQERIRSLDKQKYTTEDKIGKMHNKLNDLHQRLSCQNDLHK